MARNLSKVCSFLLLFLISVIALNQLTIMSYSDTLKKIFYFLTIILTVFSGVITLITSKSGFFKFIGAVILIALMAGGILSIVKPGFNIGLYGCLILTSVYSMIDIFYKPV